MYESRPGVKLYYYYDSYGNLSAIRYVLPDGENGTDGTNEIYYVTTNAQGDVLGIYTSAGVQVAAYEYDAWGNCTVFDVTQDSAGNNVFTEVTYSESQKFNMEFLNPFRYRGRYYDQDMGLYYLQSRYYDPHIGRFINADGVISSTGSSVQGYNVFAYCFNNPVNMDDQSGNWPKWVQKIGNTIKSTVSNVINKVKSVVSKVKQDVENFDIKNTSEKKVLDSNYISAYKGKLTMRINGNRSGSYGALFITRETNSRANPEDIVRHEYGHTKQLEQLGIVNYTLCIGVPSLFEWGSDPEYYRRPWEITADIYGGVQSRSYPGYETAGFEYLENSKKWGVFVWLTID